jgi:serine/threonine protein kinase
MRISPRVSQISEYADKLIEPHSKVALRGDLRSFAGLINLERLSDRADAFHRIYRGQHPTRRDRVVLHLYDLSASDADNALDLARREFDSIQLWQKARFMPSLLDSFQEAEGYPGELHFFSLVDPAAPALRERRKDPQWTPAARLGFAASAIAALKELHQPSDDAAAGPTLHRQITPRSLRVRHNNDPLFTELNLTRLGDAVTLAPTGMDFGDLAEFYAPEVRRGGLAVADPRSDVFSLCASLRLLFDADDPLSRRADAALAAGCAAPPEQRASLDALAASLAALADAGAAPQTDEEALPAAEFWDEDTVVPFQQSRYKILGRLGGGGVGQTFKVVELDADSDERFGTYVAKLIDHEADGRTVIRAYRLARAYTAHPNLSAIHEIAAEWQADRFAALLRWVEGIPLADLAGVLPIHAEDIGEASVERLLLHWLTELCGGLTELHRVGLVHGDVSPRNIIVQRGSTVLTDYDTVLRAGEIPRRSTALYASPAVQEGVCIEPADDIYALAASLFHVVADREPFLHGAERRKDLGLCWDGIEGCEELRPFFDRATSPDPATRFRDGAEARGFLQGLVQKPGSTAADEPEPPVTLSENTVPWLGEVLSAYPGARHGNAETRGLDSDFALQTYVETPLDNILLEDIRAGRVNLVILFGNAGDGKTAFLQHLVRRLGVEDIHSSRRVWETTLEGNRRLMVNLDGAAAWQGRDANELLDELFAPFHTPDFPTDRVHVVAVNNGKLLEWVETQPADTWLTSALRELLLFDKPPAEPRFRLIDLNRRSLVGGLVKGGQEPRADFLNTLIDRLLGADANPWQPCDTCTARDRCTAWASVRLLRDPVQGSRLRSRVTDLLQACHQRGEIHITARELRAALSYALFGLDHCEDLHAAPDARPAGLWRRLFDAASERRQGELLAEMARFDPALESDPIIDRTLLRRRASPGGINGLADARRQAWLLGDGPEAEVQLMHGRHLARFRAVPAMADAARATLLRDLCLGIARLEDLPPRAFAPEQLVHGVPLRITPRTPTESAFWVVKPWNRFNLSPALPPAAEGLERLHTHLHLTYRYGAGGAETLILGLELFHLLLELEAGMQLSGVGEEGVFANLEIFTQRLASEDARLLHAWHPSDEEQLYRVRIEARDGRQVLLREPL